MNTYYGKSDNKMPRIWHYTRVLPKTSEHGIYLAIGPVSYILLTEEDGRQRITAHAPGVTQ